MQKHHYDNWPKLPEALPSWLAPVLTALAILLFLAFLASGPAHATGRGGDVQFGDKTTVSPSFRVNPSADATGIGVGIGRGGSGGDADARAVVRGVKAEGGKAIQGQHQGQGQIQGLRNTSRVSGRNDNHLHSDVSADGRVKSKVSTTDTVTIGGDNYEAAKFPVPSVYVSSNPANNTADCVKVWNGGGGANTGAFALSIEGGGAITDKDCARLRAYQMGRDDSDERVRAAAVAAFLDQDVVRAAVDREAAKQRSAIVGGGHGVYVSPTPDDYSAIMPD